MNGDSVVASLRSVSLLLIVLIGVSPAASPALAQEPVPPLPTPASAGSNPPAPAISPDWWATVQEQIRRAEYEVTWQEQTYLADLPAAFQAPNRAHNLRTYFAGEGPVVIPRVWPDETPDPPWRWAISLAGWGREGALQPIPEAALEAHQHRIAYVRGPLGEAYRNDESGLEQRLVLAAPPPGDGIAGPVRFELLLTTDLVPHEAEEDGVVEFAGPDGRPVLHYGPPLATDAAGHTVPASLSWLGSRLALVVNDAAAVYPLQVACLLTGLPATWNWKVEGNEPDVEFGRAVSTAGDVNGDGYSDVIVGAPKYDGGQADQGKAYLFLGSRSGLDTTPAWTKVSAQASAEFGGAVSTAGDLNKDGRAEVIVGAHHWTDGQSQEGAAWIYYGTAGGLNLVPGHYLQGNQVDAHAGIAVGTAGDLNDDGFADIIIGAYFYDNPQHDEGVAWVWYGPLSGTSPPPDWQAESDQADAHLGNSVATAGDVNGDGFADIIVGAPEYDDGQEDEGAAFVWHGLTTGLNNGVNGTPANADWTKEGDQADALFGTDVNAAGDVNGDGWADVIVGGPYWESSSGTSDEGGAWVYRGSAAGLVAAPIFDHQCDQDGHCGTAVSTAGDVNGDGYADIVVGAPDFTNGQFEEGRVWVYYGAASGPADAGVWSVEGAQTAAHLGISVATAGDVNGDGYSDVILGAYGYQSADAQADEGAAYVYHGSVSDLSEDPGWTKASAQELAQFGWSLGTAGDVNGDGYADVAVGSPGWDDGEVDEGGAWIYLGQGTGLASPPAWYEQGNSPSAQFGYSVGTAGDVNGDGYDDLIVGAPGWDNPQTDEGGAFVYPGSADGLRTTPLWSKASNQPDAQFGYSVGTAGDVDGDGYADIVVGAPFWQRDGYKRGGVWLYQGSAGGPHLTPDWYEVADQADAQYGYAVGTAGDVNRDGYSDLIVGSPYWEDDAINEGRAWVYLGSSSGLRHDLHWHAESNQFSARLGHAVGTAGDVNGDGCSDVIVGAPYWGDGGLSNEGKVWVYHGSASGLNPAHAWSKESDQNSALYGYSVGTAGDVNGDGYADIALGAPLMNGAVTDEGAARVYLGSAAGLGDSPHWRGAGGPGGSWYGQSVGTAGDVNGDGYADLLVGAPSYDGTKPREGRALLYYGNGGRGVSLRPRQVRTDNSAPIAHLGRSDTMTGWSLSTDMRTPFGRGGVAQQFEVKALGESFNGHDTRWWGYYDDPVPGTPTSIRVDTARAGTHYHWRIRLRYDPATTPWMPASRWLTMPWNGWNEMDLRTAGERIALPLVVKE